MDHAIMALKEFYVAELDDMFQDWNKNNYEKFTDCPFYVSANAIYQGIRSMEKYYYGEVKCMSPQGHLRWHISEIKYFKKWSLK
jgi:hypothetical protein